MARAVMGEEFLGIDRLVEGDGAGAKVGDGFGSLEAVDGEGLGIEGMLVRDTRFVGCHRLSSSTRMGRTYGGRR